MDNGNECFAPAIFRTIVDHSDEPIGITDSTQRFVYANQAVTDLLGYPSIVGLTIADILSQDETIYLHPEAIKTRQKLQRYAFLRHQNGNTFECEISGIPYEDNTGKYVVYRVNKIEERFKKELETARELYSKLFDYMPDAILLHHGGIITHVNPAACRLFKAETPEALLGHSAIELVHPDFHDNVKQRIAASSQQAGYVALPMEEKLLALDGSLFFAEVSTTSIQIDETVSTLVMVRDITSEKYYKEKLEALNKDLEIQIEDELRQRREQEQLLIQQSKLASMGEMIGAIAHQWRQPLNALAINIQDLVDAKEHGELNDEYLQNLVARSMKQINYMSTTIDDFRNYFKSSKTKSGFNLAKALEDVLNILSAQLKHHGISTTLNLRDIPESTRVWGYENEIKQVLINIINNAKDAIDETGRGEGTIQIELNNPTDEEITITICDDGCGIKETIREKIFDPYFTTKDQGKGTGIGLYMSKTIIEQNMGGRLELAKQPLQTCFTITLPLKDAHADL